MSVPRSPTKKVVKSRIPNAFMIFVKEQNRNLLRNCPEEDRARIGAYLGRKWRSMSVEEKQVYYDKFNVLKENQKDKCDSNAAVEENVNLKIGRCTVDVSDINCNVSESFSTEQSFHKLTNQVANVDDLSIRSSAKPKKSGRPPNAYFIFAKEHKHSIKKDKKIHNSIVLGNMWRDLPASEKAKYYVEAKRLLTLHRKNEPASEKIPKRKKKVVSQTVLNKPIMRPRRRNKMSYDISSNLQKEVTDTEQTTIVSNSVKLSDKYESTGSTNPPSEPLAVNEYPISTCPHQHNSSMNNLHRMPPVVDAHSSMLCCCQSSSFALHGCGNMKQNSVSSAEISPQFFGSSLPRIFPSYPFNTSPWMYPPPLAPQWFPFSMPSFYSSPYRWPYSHDSSYVGYYASQYGVIGSSTHTTSKTSISETTTSASNQDESTEIAEKNGISEEEVVIVDEDSSEEQ